ncbi:hypothetical protein [Streptomyces sp. NPDC017529]|uniref:hypothetical protein n=1 Tax=Streptomyces sp. NPDC017529 TaxID=3365000 RepID=UPI0037B752A3
MDAEEARHVDATLRRLGIPGIVAPEDPGGTGGAWRVYDRPDPGTRQDITPDALAAVVAKFRGESPETTRRADGGPTRGFVIPPGQG